MARFFKTMLTREASVGILVLFLLLEQMFQLFTFKDDVSCEFALCCAVLSCFSRVWLFVTPWTVAHQSPLSMGFPRQEYWSGLPGPPPRDLPDSGIEPESLMSPALADGFFTTSATWEARVCLKWPLLCWDMLYLSPLSGEIFMNGCWILLNELCLYWDNHTVFLFQFVNVVYHINWLLDIEKSCAPGINSSCLWCFFLLTLVEFSLLVFCWGSLHPHC